MKNKRWVLKEADESKIQSLQDALGVHPVLCQLLVLRGIDTFDKAHLYFRPSLEHLHDPFLMEDMFTAVNRIIEAMHKKEKILVYGDYDVDGTTSVALMYSFLHTHHDELDYYLPDRYKEGYGISLAGIDYAADNDVSLIIALDCGIKAIEQVNYASSKGIDFIICDHHRPGNELPKAVAVLDPKRSDCEYPYKELSGCGIGFKLCQALASELSIPDEELYKLLDLVAVSIASDIVPLTDENRVLAHFGLKKLNENPRPGLKALIDSADVQGNIDISAVVFYIGPRINAAGRMHNAKMAVRLLISEHAKEAEEIAMQLSHHNSLRKEEDKKITEQALEMLKNDPDNDGRKTTVLFKPDWHKGVIGIVASRLVDHYYRPTVILTQSQNEAVGSARSVKGFDVYEALKTCSSMMNKFGGHKYAAGMSMDVDKFSDFREQFELEVCNTILPEQLVPEVEIDAIIGLKQVNWSFYKILIQMAPFGPGNSSPLFMVQDAADKGKTKIVGDNHLKLNLDNGDKAIDGIAFGKGDFHKPLKNGKKVDLCFAIEENVWNGYRNLQLNVKDMKIAEIH